MHKFRKFVNIQITGSFCDSPSKITAYGTKQQSHAQHICAIAIKEARCPTMPGSRMAWVNHDLMRLWHPELPPCWLGPCKAEMRIASTCEHLSSARCLTCLKNCVNVKSYYTDLDRTSAIFSALSLFKLVAEALWLTPSTCCKKTGPLQMLSATNR